MTGVIRAFFKRALAFFDDLSFRYKLAFSYLLLIIPLALTVFLVTTAALKANETKAREVVLADLEDTAASVVTSLSDVELLAKLMAESPVLTNWYDQSRDRYANRVADYLLQYQKYVLPQIELYVRSDPAINRIVFFTRNRQVFESAVSYPASRYEREAWFPSTTERSLTWLAWESVHERRTYEYDQARPGRVISLFHSVLLTAPDNATLFEIELSADRLFGKLADLDVPTPWALTAWHPDAGIMNATGTALDEGTVTRIMQDPRARSLVDGAARSAIISDEGGRFQVNAIPIGRTGTLLLGIARERDLRAPFVRAASVTSMTFLASCAALTALSLLLARRLLRRLGRVLVAVRAIQDGDFDVSPDVHGRDEIGELAADIELMASRIRQLIDSEYTARIARREAEIMALHAQIRPHFIFNVLESIRMRAVLADQKEIAASIAALGSTLRYNSSIDMPSVTLEREISVLTDYVRIQNLVHNDRIRFTVDCDQATLGAEIPSFIIQPIIENSIVHGLRGSGRRLEVVLCARRVGSSLHITVEDDGRGMPARQRSLGSSRRRDDASAWNPRRGIGLSNINHRLKLRFGRGYRFELGQRKNGGTLVSLHLPLKRVPKTAKTPR